MVQVESEDNVREGKTTTPGDAQGVPVAHEQAVEGSSEEFTFAEGMHVPPTSASEEETDHSPAAGDFKSLP